MSSALPSAPPAHSPVDVETAPATVDILGVAVHCVDFAATLARIGEWIAEPAEERSPGCRQVCTVNTEFIVDARRLPAFGAVLQRADLRVPDGVGVIWAARLLGAPLRERVTGSDGIFRICARAAQEGWRVYLLGAGTGVAEAASANLCARYPGLQIVGTYGGSPHEEAWPEIYARLHAARPDILFVAYGHPRQDHWIDGHRRALPVRVAIGCGGALDFAAGVAARAPLWMQKSGLEWLHRLWQQPWRWRRMLKLPYFGLLVLGRALPICLARVLGMQRSGRGSHPER